MVPDEAQRVNCQPVLRNPYRHEAEVLQEIREEHRRQAPELELHEHRAAHERRPVRTDEPEARQRQRANRLVHGEPDGSGRGRGDTRQPLVRNLADGLETAQLQPPREPGVRTPDVGKGHLQAALDQAAILTHLALEERGRQPVVPANPVLGAAVRAAAMENVERGGVEVDRARPVLVAERAFAVRVSLHPGTRPGSNALANGAGYAEFDLGLGHGSSFTQQTKAPSKPNS